MSRLKWSEPGSRLYETGLDRGVLYVEGKPGVAWNGLVSVAEKASGGESRPYYIDGVKYLNLSSPEEYEATLTAFYSPAEFDSCDGSLALVPGFQAQHQMRSTFDLSYRSLIGNDISGGDHAYKIHLIYNATASPASRTYATLDGNADAQNLSWNLTAQPVIHPDIIPTAHFVADTSKLSPLLKNWLESTLYGDQETPPRMPTIPEILSVEPGVYGIALYNIDIYA